MKTMDSTNKNNKRGILGNLILGATVVGATILGAGCDKKEERTRIEQTTKNIGEIKGKVAEFTTSTNNRLNDQKKSIDANGVSIGEVKAGQDQIKTDIKTASKATGAILSEIKDSMGNGFSGIRDDIAINTDRDAARDDKVDNLAKITEDLLRSRIAGFAGKYQVPGSSFY